MTERDIVFYLVGAFELNGVPTLSFSHGQLKSIREKLLLIKRKERTEFIDKLEASLNEDPRITFELTQEYWNENIAPSRKLVTNTIDAVWGIIGSSTKRFVR